MHLFSVILALSFMFTVNGLEDPKVIGANCMRQVGLDPALLVSKNSQMIQDNEEKIKCMVACVFKANKIAREDGTIDVENIMKLLTNVPEEDLDRYREAVEKCSLKRGSNECETAFLIGLCLKSEMTILAY